uniref:Transposase (Putative), gypsy type n=1 Tax=Tanacetum cinerariifolium TaxID=118510 RepID=A0A699HNG7_TANCI|nr:transposase (putative), gypsy type [Tanacetum cinerariifolium]
MEIDQASLRPWETDYEAIQAEKDIRSVLTQKGLEVFCEAFHIPDVVHPQLPSPNQTIHEMPTEKIAKVSHFEILCRVHGVEPTVALFRCFYVNSKNKEWMSFSKRPDSDSVCYTKPLDSLKRWNDHVFWVDSFACLASFPWHIGKIVFRDPFSKSRDFRADDYAILVAHPASFQKYSKPFLCWIGMSQIDLFSFIQVADPMKVKVGELERAEGETRLLDSIMGRVVLLLPVAPAYVDSELEASVERIVSGEDVAAEKPRRLRKKTQATTDVGGSSHPLKKLRSDYGTSSVAVNVGKSLFALKDLLASSVLNVESGIEVVASLPFVTSSVYATPECDSGVLTASVTGPSLHPIGKPERFVIFSYSSHHSTNASEADVDSIIRSAVIPPILTEAVITTQIARTVRPDTVGSSHAPGKELSMGSLEVNSKSLHEVFVSCWNIPNDALLDSLDASREFINHLAPLVLFAQICDMDYEDLFTEFSVGTARQACLSAEVRMLIEFCLSERRRLESELGKQTGLLKSKDDEVEDLKARLLLKEAGAAESIRLRAEASNFEAVEKSLRDEVSSLKEHNIILEKERNALDVKATDLAAFVMDKECAMTTLNAQLTAVKSQNDIIGDQVHELEVASFGLQKKLSSYENLAEPLEEFQDAQLKIVNDKFDELYADFIEMALHLEERFYPHLLTTISGRQWLLTHGIELAVTKCLHSFEYLYALGAPIGRAIEKGMQDGLSTRITHGAEGRTLTDVAAYNPSMEADYVSALQHLQSVNFSLIAELRSNKDARVDTLMNILRLEETLAERLGLTESQPHVDQLMVPIHYSPDKVVVGATSLSFALDVSNVWVRKIRENIAGQRSALCEIFIPLSKPFSAEVLTDVGGTFDTVPATATTALSTTLASASTVAHISVDDY